MILPMYYSHSTPEMDPPVDVTPPDTAKPAANIFAPANVCVPLVTMPPLVPSAGAGLNTPEGIIAPFT